MNEEAVMSYLTLPIEFYGNFEKVNSLISKIRARIFYKYINRNRTFITDEFAELLIGSLPYVPIKGIFDKEEGDFQGHAKATDGRIYGIVPETPNWQWEDHVDEDGVTRNYLCCDVYVYTGIYEEAEVIKNKKLSMELYPPTLRAEWMIYNGAKVLKYTYGEFLGLQVLGEGREPCFEGAGFQEVFTLLEELKNKTAEVLEASNFTIRGGQQTVPLIFELNDSDKNSLLWKALNPVGENGEWRGQFWIVSVYEDRVVYQNNETMEYFRASYTKNSDDTITLGEATKCFIVDVSETEQSALSAVRVMNEGSFENIDVNYTQLQNDKTTLSEKVDTLTGEIGAHTATIETLNGKISEYTVKVDTLTQESGERQATIDTLTAEVTSLNEFKLAREKSEKEALIAKYSLILDEEVITEFTNNIDSYTIDALTDKLSVAYVNSKPDLFERQPTGKLIPTGEPTYSGAELILKNYISRKNGGNR